MSAYPAPGQDADASTWREDGRRAGSDLGRASVVLVLAEDPESAALFALGIGDVQARRRRVAVGDLAGGLAALASNPADEDAPGLVDCFTYGVSLNRIARPVAGHANLFVLPSGTEGIEAELFANPRWRRFAAAFREAGAMLLLVARAEEPGLSALSGVVDGAFVLESARAPQGIAALGRTTRADRREALPSPLGQRAAAVAADAPSFPVVDRRAVPRGWRLRHVRDVVTVGALAAAGLLVLAVRYGSSPRHLAAGTAQTLHVDSASAMLSAATAIPPDVRLTAEDISGKLVATDSAHALGYAVEVAAMNTVGGALDKLRSLSGAPAPTISPIVLADRARWFTVIVGAAPTAAAADSVLRQLRRNGVIDPDGGAVVRVPFALLIAEGVNGDSSDSQVRAYVARGLPAYALRQLDGSARLFAGAFATPAQSWLLAQSLRLAGLTPAVAFRTGSTY